MVIIRRGDTFILQRRPLDPNIGAAGLIGCFGGKKEKDESDEAAAYRELLEELDIHTDHSTIKLTYMTHVSVESDYQQSVAIVNAAIFELILEESTDVQAKEGELVVMTLEDIKRDIASLTPATREAFNYLIRST